MAEDNSDTNPLKHIIQSEYAGVPTGRGVDRYAEVFGMERSQMLDWLKGKHVLDIASGDANIAKEVAILERNSAPNNTTITSLDLDYARRPLDKKLILHEPDSDFAYAQSTFRKNAVAASYRNLPFADNSFDGVLASFTFGISAVDSEQARSAYKEVHRVLKPDAEGLISVHYNPETDRLFVRDKNNKNVVWEYDLSDIGYLHPTLHKTVVQRKTGPKDLYYLRVNKAA